MQRIARKQGIPTALILFACALVPSPGFSEVPYFTAGFDCTKAKTRIEVTVCSVKELADADREMATRYRDLRASLSPNEQRALKQDQVSWLKEREAACADAAKIDLCLIKSYAQRIDVLETWKRQKGRRTPSNEASLSQRLLSPDKTVQEAAIKEIDALDTAAKELLSRKLAETIISGDEATQRRAARGLTKIGAPAAPFVVQIFNNENREVRLYVMMILGDIGPAAGEAVPTMIKGVSDLDAIVRIAAADALGKTKSASPGIIGALVKATGDKDPTVRSRACQALGTIGPGAATAVPAIVAVLEDEGTAGRDQAAISLMRQQAAVALGQIGVPSDAAVSALIAALKDKQEYVRYAAGQALVKIGPPAMPALLRSLKDADMYTRIEAVRAISEIRPATPEAEPALIAALNDDNYSVRSGAAFALRKMNTESSRAAVANYEQDERMRTEQVKMKREENRHRLYPKGEIVSNVPSDPDHKYPLELVYGFSIVSYNQNELYVTLHRGKDRPDLLRIWLRVNDTYALVKEMRADEEGMDRFGQVDAIWYDVRSDHREQFIHVPVLHSGTGGFQDHTIYCVLPDMTLQEIQYEPATIWYKNRLKKGEAIWGGEKFTFSRERLGFVFYLWKDRDPMCCPTAGKIVGTYKIEGARRYDFGLKKDVAEFKMVVDTFERQQVDKP